MPAASCVHSTGARSNERRFCSPNNFTLKATVFVHTRLMCRCSPRKSFRSAGFRGVVSRRGEAGTATVDKTGRIRFNDMTESERR